MPLKSVIVPDEMMEEFTRAQEDVEGYFSELKLDPSEGTITAGQERYIIVRAASLSVHFLEFIMDMYPALEQAEALDASARVMYDLARAIGQSDARHFHDVTKVKEPIEKLSMGPVHFAYTGWAKVRIMPESSPSPDESFFLLYDHLNTFEADAWLDKRGKDDFCTCHWSAGYSAGWCTESFNVPLDAREFMCRSKGDASCRFVMAHRNRLSDRLEAWKREHPDE
ncbi:MAG: 4-vinyl reductase [Deltaproteobacteria bacterium]|nr:4-vinyl reductase [Deltaproteobacteria bacterium]